MTLDSLSDLTERYKNSLSSPRIPVSERKTNNSKLKGLFTDAKVLLNEQLKCQMVRYENSNPDFYAGYLNASQIVEYGIRHEKPEVEISQ